jgi:hypothetical protein
LRGVSKDGSESVRHIILRDAAKRPLLRMRSVLVAIIVRMTPLV